MAAIETPAILAANVNWDLIKLIGIALVMIAGGFVKKVAEKREQMERAKSPKRPPLPANLQSRDNRFRNEIEAFLDEVGRRRAEQPGRPEVGRGPAPVRPVTSGPPSARIPSGRVQTEQARTTSQQKMRPAARPEKPKQDALRTSQTGTSERADSLKPLTYPGARPRPGTEIASRKAPVSEDLGAEIRSHLSQYLDTSRMSQRIQSDVGNAIEKIVQDHLGSSGVPSASVKPALSTGPSPIISMLRNTAGVRAAIVVNEILGPPRGLRRKT